jgi:hypothetical protein
LTFNGVHECFALNPLEKYTRSKTLSCPIICIFELFQELATSVRAAHAGRTPGFIHHFPYTISNENLPVKFDFQLYSTYIWGNVE